MLVFVVDNGRAALAVDGLRMQREIARGVDLVYSAEGYVELAGERYRLEANLIPLSEPSDEEEPGP